MFCRKFNLFQNFASFFWLTVLGYTSSHFSLGLFSEISVFLGVYLSLVCHLCCFVVNLVLSKIRPILLVKKVEAKLCLSKTK